MAKSIADVGVYYISGGRSLLEHLLIFLPGLKGTFWKDIPITSGICALMRIACAGENDFKKVWLRVFGCRKGLVTGVRCWFTSEEA